MLRTAVALSVVCALLGLTAAASAGEGAKVGSPAPQFELTDVMTGQTTTLAEHKGKVVVLVWHSIHCPWYWNRPEAGYDRILIPTAKKYAEQGVVFLGINSNKNESVDALKAYHQKHNLTYPILKDPGNKVADAYGARTTPHIFVIDDDEAQTLVYKGGLEKAPASPEQCGKSEEQYLEPVLTAVLANQTPPVTETRSKGCGIQRE